MRDDSSPGQPLVAFYNYVSSRFADLMSMRILAMKFEPSQY